MKLITLEDDIKIRTFSPPSGFDPLRATSAELARVGFPAVPDDPRHRARFEKVMRQMQGKMKYVEPTFRVNKDRKHGPRDRHAQAGTETTTNWSGGVIFAPSGQNFHWVQGDWVVPNVFAPKQNQWFYCASWIGIDGDGSSDVCQIGVECEIYQSGSSITRHIYPWWEWYPLPEVQITNFAVSPGDMITALLCTSGATATSATAFLTNRTSGLSTSFTFNAPSGTQLVGNSAEWVVEAPTVGGSQSQIADYGEVFFSVCEAVTNSTTIEGGTGDDINLSASGSVVSDGILITPTIIQCSYSGQEPS